MLLSRRESHPRTPLAALPWERGRQVPVCPAGAARILPLPQQEGKGGDRGVLGWLVTPRGTRQPKQPLLAQCQLPAVHAGGGETALSCPAATSKPCPCWGSHQPGLWPPVRTRSHQPVLEEGAGVLLRGAQVPGWPHPPARPGREERRWQCQLGQRGGDTGRDKAARRGCSRDRGQPSVPHRQMLAREPLLPLHMAVRCPEVLQEGSDSVAPLH